MINSIKQYLKVVGVKGLAIAIKGQLSNTTSEFTKTRKDGAHPINLRLPGADVYTYEQIFMDEEYKFNTQQHPKTIIDAGANIGLTAIYFTNKYPNAKIIAIEPEKSNFDLLTKNIASYPNITAIQAAVWHKNEKINLVDPGLGEWGFMTEDADSAEKIKAAARHEVDAMTIDRIMEKFNLDHVDILKIDVEGAEKEVFADSSAWINKVDSIIAELHERMKTGANRSFYNGSNGFDNEWQRGENVYLSRKNGLSIAN
jgi:FkbM family methyltransferase